MATKTSPEEQARLDAEAQAIAESEAFAKRMGTPRTPEEQVAEDAIFKANFEARFKVKTQDEAIAEAVAKALAEVKKAQK